MRVSKSATGIAFAAALMTTTAACVTDPVTGERKVSKAAIGGAIGAVGGYLAGDLVGGNNDRTERIVGAGIGAIAGGAVGAYMDKQERELRERTAGTGIDVVRQGDEIILNMPSAITFAFDSYSIEPEFRDTLNEVGRTLADYPSTYIDIYGHTDSVGTDAYNLTLSRNRAQSVASYLSTRGVASARIATQGFGETQPITSNETEEGRSANRRVEIRIVPVEEDNGY